MSRIRIITDFKDERAVNLLRKHKLLINDLVSYYLVLDKNLDENKVKSIENLVPVEEHLQIIDSYVNQFATTAAINYELTKQKSFEIFCTDKTKQEHSLKSNIYVFENKFGRKFHEDYAEHCQDMLNGFDLLLLQHFKHNIARSSKRFK